jgi:hypothetical protein
MTVHLGTGEFRERRPRYTGLNVVYGYTPAGSFEAAPYGYRMTYGRRAFFGYTTVPDGRTWWFARLPAGEVANDELTGITPARWRDRALGFFAADDTPPAEIIRCADDVHGSTPTTGPALATFEALRRPRTERLIASSGSQSNTITELAAAMAAGPQAPAPPGDAAPPVAWDEPITRP